jgi:small subunit ribosomal protein S3
MQAGAQGIKIIVKGRISGSEIARTEKLMLGQVPLHTLRANIDYALSEAHTIMGRVGCKVWVYTGEVMPTRSEEAEELETIEVTVQAGDPDIDLEELLDQNSE